MFFLVSKDTKPVHVCTHALFLTLSRVTRTVTLQEKFFLFMYITPNLSTFAHMLYFSHCQELQGQWHFEKNSSFLWTSRVEEGPNHSDDSTTEGGPVLVLCLSILQILFWKQSQRRSSMRSLAMAPRITFITTTIPYIYIYIYIYICTTRLTDNQRKHCYYPTTLPIEFW
jgi:hypothetical protein